LNSRVVHSGFHEKPGTLKARLALAGSRLLIQYASDKGVPLLRCGMLIAVPRSAIREGLWKEIGSVWHLWRGGRSHDIEFQWIVSSRSVSRIAPIEALGGIFIPSVCVVNVEQLIGALQQDEKRLTRLIDGLSRIIAQQKARPPKPEPRPRAPAERPAGSSGQTPGIDNDKTPDAGLARFSGDFARLKGSLRLPVRGTVSNRFGTARQEGSTWKGLFIRAAAGGDVHAVAAGRVVFADWMRGFGNLLILDHGDGYLTIYGNNESLYKHVGETVKPGEVVAVIGNSGGNPESGLYFELRHQGQPLDPLKWASLK
jgi:murein DD-endopeptidase MepM/ murein hydrolase activator NlpD